MTRKIFIAISMITALFFTARDISYSWSGVAWGPLSREEIMSAGNAMRTLQWSTKAAFTNYGYSGANKSYAANTLYTGIPYSQGNPQDDALEFCNLLRGTNGGYIPSGYGNDCSGFVSICWKLPGRYVTSTFGGGIGSYWDALGTVGSAQDCATSSDTSKKLLPGDAFNSVSGGHIILFDSNVTGGIQALEQTPWNVRNRVWTYTGLSIYQPLRRKQLTDGTSGPGNGTPPPGGGGGGDGGSEPPPPLPPDPPPGDDGSNQLFDFRLGIAPLSGEVSIGGSISPVVTATLISGKTQSVNFTILDLPSGVSANSLSPLSPTGSRTLTITANSGVAQGTYSIRIKAAGGDAVLESTFELTVKDNSSPTQVSYVNDGTGPDIDITGSVDSLAANWSASSDAESGVDGYLYAVGTTPGGTNIAGWTENGLALSVQQTGLSLSNGQTYYFSVKARNGAGLLSTPKNSNGLKVDNLPALVTVKDGTWDDIDVTKSQTQLSANWTPSGGTDSGISMYWYAIGSLPGDSDIVAWVPNGLQLYKTVANLSLSAGTTYYFSVKAVSGVGFESVSTSDGVLYDPSYSGDITPPSKPAVNDGTGTDISIIASTTQLSANWTPATDPESGIVKYQYAIGSSSITQDVEGWTENGLNLSVTASGLALADGSTYYFLVKAFNGVGLTSDSSSDGVLVKLSFPADATPPSASVVNDGLGGDIDIIKSSTQVSANWTAASDPESGISKYYYAIGTAAGLADIKGWNNNGLELSVTVTGLSLLNAGKYYFSVKAANCAGLETVSSSDGFLVNVNLSASDVTPPSGVTVSDGPGSDIDVIKITDRLYANWTAATDSESGILKYSYAVGTSSGLSDIVGWTDSAVSRSVSRTGLSLLNGTSYYFSVKVINGVGLESISYSDGVLVDVNLASDSTLPSAFAVYDSTGADIEVTKSSSQLSANWTPSVDPESGISKYWYAVGTTQVGTQLIPWTENALNLSVTINNLSLINRSSYYFSVKAENGLGGTIVCNSNGVMVNIDTTSPFAVTVNDGLATDIETTRLTTQLSGNWSDSYDGESDIVRYMYAIGSSSSTTDIMGWIDNGKSLQTTVKGLSLSQGAKYYFLVKVVNSVGLATVCASNGVSVNVNWTGDSTPPTNVIVNDGTGEDIDFTNATDRLSANWAESFDPESGVVRYYYFVDEIPSNEDSDPSTWLNNGTKRTATITGLHLETNKTYYFTVVTVNGANLKSFSSSNNGIRVDTTPPVISTFTSSTHQMNVDWSTNTLPSISWCGSDASGVKGYYYLFDKTAGHTPSEVKSQGISTSATYYIEPAPKSSGAWYFHLVAEDAAANISSSVYSYPVRIESSPPLKIDVVNDGTGADVDSTNSISQLWANWSAGVDPESGVQRYWYALGTSAGSTNVVNWTSGTETSVAVVTPLDPGQRYYFAVKAENRFAMFSEPAYSDGVVIDTIPPRGIIAVTDAAKTSSVALSKIGTGKFKVALTIEEENSISGTPTLNYRSPGGISSAVALTGDSTGKIWQGAISVESLTPEGTAYFVLSARDEAGNAGAEIKSGASVEIDVTVYSAAGGVVSNNDNTSVDIPSGACDDNINVEITVPDVNSQKIKDALRNIIDDKGIFSISGVNLNREFTALAVPANMPVIRFNKPVTITIPYPDSDNDGIVDGTSVSEDTLKIFYLDEAARKYTLVPNSVVDKINKTVSVSVEHFSVYVIMSFVPPVSVSEAYSYPNPCYMRTVVNGYMKIANIPLTALDVKIYIYNIAGELVRTLKEDDVNEIVTEAGSKVGHWDGRNDVGEKVSSGVYIYLLKSKDGKKIDKAAIIW